MGKLIGLITMLVFIDLLFLATGQLTLDSPSSIIITALQDPSALKDLNWWKIISEQIAILAITATVIAGIATRSSDILIWIPTSIFLSLMIGDFLAIYSHLASINQPLAIIIMSPIMVIFAITILEWVRGKD